eukprot:jgi/Tetstr1/462687/TSEL_007653.t1
MLPALVGTFGLVRRVRRNRLQSFSLAPGTPDPVPRALPDPFSLDRLTFPEASVDVCEVLSSNPNDKLTPAERNALDPSAGDMKGSVRPIGIGSVLVRPDLLDTPSMRTQLSLPVQFGGLGIGDNVVIADVSHIGAAALVVGQAVTFLRAQHVTLSDAGAFFSDPSGVSSPHSLYLVGASSIHQALATPTLEPNAGANVSAPM